MMRLLQRLFGPRLKALPLLPTEETPWTEQDAAALLSFVNSLSGRRMVRRLQFEIQQVNASAVARAQNCEFNCGYARGYRAALDLFLSANVPPHPDDHSQEPDGAEALSERFAP